MRDIMLKVRQIDPRHNGFVTLQELDDIIKMSYPEQLNTRDICPIISKFESPQYKVLIDYKQLADWILLGLNKLKKRDEMEAIKIARRAKPMSEKGQVTQEYLQ